MYNEIDEDKRHSDAKQAYIVEHNCLKQDENDEQQ